MKLGKNPSETTSRRTRSQAHARMYIQQAAHCTRQSSICPDHGRVDILMGKPSTNCTAPVAGGLGGGRVCHSGTAAYHELSDDTLSVTIFGVTRQPVDMLGRNGSAVQNLSTSRGFPRTNVCMYSLTDDGQAPVSSLPTKVISSSR